METNEGLNVDVGMDVMSSADVGETAMVGNSTPNGLIIAGAAVLVLGLGYLAYQGIKMVRRLIVQKQVEKLVKEEIEEPFTDEKKVIEIIKKETK